VEAAVRAGVLPPRQQAPLRVPGAKGEPAALRELAVWAVRALEVLLEWVWAARAEAAEGPQGRFAANLPVGRCAARDLFAVILAAFLVVSGSAKRRAMRIHPDVRMVVPFCHNQVQCG